MNTSAQTHQELAQLRRRVQIFYTDRKSVV